MSCADAWKDFQSSSLATVLLGFNLGFGPGERNQKQWLTRAHLLTQDWEECGGHNWLWTSSPVSLKAVFSQPTAVHTLGLLSKPHFPVLSPPLQQETQNSGWGGQGCGTDHAHSFSFVLPSADHVLRYSP